MCFGLHSGIFGEHLGPISFALLLSLSPSREGAESSLKSNSRFLGGLAPPLESSREIESLLLPTQSRPDFQIGLQQRKQIG